MLSCFNTCRLVIEDKLLVLEEEFFESSPLKIVGKKKFVYVSFLESVFQVVKTRFHPKLFQYFWIPCCYAHVSTQIVRCNHNNTFQL